MPSFFKKILYGKELSNPYVNPYHPGHTTLPNTSHQPSYPTYPQPAAHFPPPPTPPTPPARAESPMYSDFLGEARLLAGRDPVTGRAMQTSGNATVNENGRESIDTTTTTEPNPYLHGGDAAMGRPVARGVVNHAEIFVQSGGAEALGRKRSSLQHGSGPHGTGPVSTATAHEAGNRYDISVREERRKQEVPAGASTGGSAGGEREFYAPVRPPVREFYGGA
ncbi:uncharacterized protein EKO05_0009295 [Ascochyta rabiei]|uniref:uncharacterized protein n=1 Tax=Didymella rabiei TaxID=5454 RepID=UPI00220D3A30|nr:uncharacterized protein EKO05_0009295 [Ascochyta rabiei]UPX19018.1 hypothetical protein EKO05_0009295 [Ascochyta rabiei]